MYQSKTNRIFLGLGFALFCAGMAAGFLWDLPLNQALYSPTFLPSVLMEAFGFYPLYLPVVLWGVCLAVDTGKRSLGVRIGGTLSAFVCAIILGAVSANYLVKRGLLRAPHFLVAAGIALAVTCLLMFLLRHVKRAVFVRLHFVFFWGTVYMVLDNIVINILKIIWSRTRFDDMLAAGGAFDHFTAWIQPFGHGGTSFPSGHTAAACSIFILVLLCDVFTSWHKKRSFVWVCCWTYVGGMALCRLIIGRHYLSDTMIAIFVMTVLFFAMVKSKWYLQSLKKLTAHPDLPCEDAKT